MISFDEAQALVFKNCLRLDLISIPLSEALGIVLAEDIQSPIHMPPFNQSAMDGYAIHSSEGNSFDIIGEIQAGDDASEVKLEPGQAVRIFTGAMVPQSADTVIRQEYTNRNGNLLKITQSEPIGANIRLAGEQITKGSTAISANEELNAAAIGYLAMLGITEVQVYRKPVIRILITGNELVPPGQPLPNGKIYESNAITLLSALRADNFDAEVERIPDDFEQTSEKVKQLLATSDVLISSGGISVGDYDFMGRALKDNGVTEAFYKVKQKPGKPLFFGTTNSCKIFALPGNPAAALTGTYMYVLPALKKMQGFTNYSPESRVLPLSHEHSKRRGLTHLLKGNCTEKSVQALNHQSSAMLDSFRKANCIIQLDEEKEEWKTGDPVTVHLL